MQIDKNYFPGFTRKAIAFTIDDGNVELDRKFISIVKPAGIFGTFNLTDVNLNKYSPEDYISLYGEYGIANHVRLHPFAMESGVEYRISEDEFRPEAADENMLYRTDTEGVYHYKKPNGWRRIAEKDAYIRLVNEAKARIESVFGEGSVRSFVWPFFEQKDKDIFNTVVALGYRSLRKTGEVKDSTGYAMPADRLHWSYNAAHSSLLSEAEKFEAYPDDGELKLFVFGVHSHDFENNNCWDILEEFAYKYGNRREDFYSAPIDDIFDYEDAVESLVVVNNSVYNPSDIPLYVSLNGQFVIISPKTKIIV